MNAHAPIDAPARSLEAEQAVLGAILLYPTALGRVADLIAADDFADELHRCIFGAAEALSAQGVTPSALTLPSVIGPVDLPQGMTLAQYLARLSAEALGLDALAGVARMVKDLARRRKLVTICADAQKIASGPTGAVKASAIASELVGQLDEIASADVAPTLRAASIGDAGRRAFAAADAARNGAPSRGLSTGLRDLDATTGGLERGQGSILAGRPSMGKTAIAVEIAANVARVGHGVLYFSLEMGDVPLAQRALASIMFDDIGGAPIAYSRIARGHLTAAEMERLDAASWKLDRLPMRIEPQPGLSVSQMAARTRRTNKQFEMAGVELGLVVVDHIGLAGASSRYAGDRVREIGEISGALHALAREHDVHVLMLSQLSRAIESRSDKRPQLHDLRESGEIEQNADLVMGVYREAYYLARSGSPDDALRLPEFENVVEIGVLKNRQGPTGTVTLFADLPANAIRNSRSLGPQSYAERRS